MTSFRSSIIANEGIELMIRSISLLGGQGLLILNNLIHDKESAKRVVTAGGLKVVFKVLMNKIKTEREGKRGKGWKREEEVRSVPIFCSFSTVG